MDSSIWKELPEVRRVVMTYQGHSDEEEKFSGPVKSQPYGIWKSDADFTWEGVRFTSVREWYGAPRNPHLFVFRQTIEPYANCDFDMEIHMDFPAQESIWTLDHYLDRENNSCGMLLTGPDGKKGVLCETTQITSFSIRVDETRDDISRHYHITAFEESPINVEKYISFHTDEEEDYEEAAFRECRNAAITRFDDLRGIGAWDYDK